MRSTSGLIDWFLSQDGTVSGFANAYFSGLPTIYISHLVSQLITQRFKLDGVFNVSSDRISKLHLLSLVKNTYGLDIDIESCGQASN